MFVYLVFFAVALGSALCVIGLSSKYNLNNLASWTGSLLMMVGAALSYGAIGILFNIIANIVFTIGAVAFLVGIYKLAVSASRTKTDQSVRIQEKTISDILQVAATRESLLELLSYSLDRFLEVFSLNSGTIHIYHDPKNILVMGAYRGLSPSHANKLELIKPGETAIGRAVQNKRVLIIRDLRVSPDYQFFGGKAEGYSFLAVVPIMVNSDCWGIIALLGRKKYHRGMLDVGLLEQFGLKLGQALVLGRENRRMATAFNRLRNVIVFYNRLFDNIKTSWETKSPWHENTAFKMLDNYSEKLLGGRPFCVFKISSGVCKCIYRQGYQELKAGYKFHDLPEEITLESLPSDFKLAEFFKVKVQELSHLIPPGFFKNEETTGYGFYYSDNVRGMVLIDEIKEVVVKNYTDDVILIKNLFTLMSILLDIRKSQEVISSVQPADDEISDIVQDLSTVFTGISGNVQLLLEQFSQESNITEIDDFIRRLRSVEQTTLKGVELVDKIGMQHNTNAVIQSALESESLNVAFYPGSKLPRIQSGIEDFKKTVIEIVKQAVENSQSPDSSGPVRLKLSGHDQSIVLTLEGRVTPGFPSADLVEKVRKHNLEINVSEHGDNARVSISNDEKKAQAAGNLNILVIENKPILRELLEDLFSRIGHEFKVVSSGNEGLANLESAKSRGETFDVVVIDMALEDIAGLELSKKIKQFDSGIYTVIISSWGVSFYANTLNDAGVDAVLHKPFRLEQLSQVLPKQKKRDATQNK